MKMKLNVALTLVLALIFFSCKKDNYEEPTSALTGRIVYQGVPILVEYDRVPYELYQFGFGKVGPVGSFTQPPNPNPNINLNTTITPEGTFSHMLFDGQYKFVISQGQGPFRWPESSGKADSIPIIVSGNTTIDIEVQPYYMIRNPQITGNGTTVTGSFALEKIITDANAKDIEQAVLFLNKTQFVGEANQIAKTELAGANITNMGSINLSVNVPAISPTQNYVFARIGVKIAGVEDLLFSPVQKITY
jgi:hypothetical protein